jgi:hypothetical protein
MKAPTFLNNIFISAVNYTPCARGNAKNNLKKSGQKSEIAAKGSVGRFFSERIYRKTPVICIYERKNSKIRRFFEYLYSNSAKPSNRGEEKQYSVIF